MKRSICTAFIVLILRLGLTWVAVASFDAREVDGPGGTLAGADGVFGRHSWRKQAEEGYEVAYVKDEKRILAAAGYRFLDTLAWGYILYIDDLVAVSDAYGTGLGTLLVQHLQKEARERGCDAVHLDTSPVAHCVCAVRSSRQPCKPG